MGTNSVYLRDLPYEFLKKQDAGFLDSSEYKEHEDLFKSKKKSAPAMAAPKPVQRIPKPVIDDMRNIMRRRYTSLDGTSVVEGDRETMSFYYIQAQSILNNDVREEKRLIRGPNASVSELNPAERSSVLRRVVENPSIRRLRTADVAASRPTVKTRPARTGNSVKDILQSSVFYQQTRSAIVYDDVLFGITQLKNALNRQGLSLGDPVWKLHPVEDEGGVRQYPYKFEDVRAMVETVKNLVRIRYASDLSAPIGDGLSNTEILRKALLMKLREPVQEPPLRVLQLNTFNHPSSSGTYSFEVDSLTDDKYYLCSVLNAETGEVDLRPRLSIDVSSSSFRFSPRTAHQYTILVAMGRDRASFRLSSLDRKQYAVDRYTFESPAARWVVDMDCADDNFILQVESEGRLVAPSSVRVVRQSCVEIEFPTPVAGDAFILSSVRNVPEVSDVIVGESNVEEVLRSVDFFRKVYAKWI